jgi:DNA ligase (NAD+)
MKIEAFLDYASQKYYEGHPIMPDEDFDKLADKYNYRKVGYDLSDGVEHLFPLYSLQKVFEGDLSDPLEKYWEDEPIVVTPKLDGAAVALVYNNGMLIRAVSRGDGKIGLDITEKLSYLVPNSGIHVKDLIQINGEVVAKKEIPNARNYAAGALGLKDIKEFLSRIEEGELTFIAYDVNPHIKSSLSSQLRSISPFKTVLDSDWEQFPHDGKVLRLDNYSVFEKLGYTSHHPRGAYALKPKPKGVVTKLLDVKWQVGKTGIVSPVAILEPVQIDNATISRATLHNIKYIEDLGLEIGCDVEIIRSGEIIPRVVRRVDEHLLLHTN